MIRSTCFVLRFLLILLTLAFVDGAYGQVFDSGPSDPALFNTVINLPTDPDIGDSGSISSGTQLNVATGGSVGSDFDSSTGSEVNVTGGNLGSGFDAFGGSLVNISGGNIGDFFDATAGSVVNIFGGNLGDNFDAFDSSDVTIFGTQFVLNNELLEGLAVDELFTIDSPIDTLSGLLADGSSFSFASGSFRAGSTVNLVTVTSVPEPSSAALLIGGMMVLGLRRHRR